MSIGPLSLSNQKLLSPLYWYLFPSGFFFFPLPFYFTTLGKKKSYWSFNYLSLRNAQSVSSVCISHWAFTLMLSRCLRSPEFIKPSVACGQSPSPTVFKQALSSINPVPSPELKLCSPHQALMAILELKGCLRPISHSFLFLIYYDYFQRHKHSTSQVA